MKSILKSIDLWIVVLGGGKGSRMGSPIPKVLCPLAGRPMLWRVLDAAASLRPSMTTVVTGGDQIPFHETVRKYKNVSFVDQANRLGTGDALAAAAAALIRGSQLPEYASGQQWAGSVDKIDLEEEGRSWKTLVLNGDVPLISSELLEEFISESLKQSCDLSVLGVKMPTPEGYGRLLVDLAGSFSKIVEEKDASPEEKKVKLCNSGILFGDSKKLVSYLRKLTPANVQGEYYLTDSVEEARKAGDRVWAFESTDYRALRGVNSPDQLLGLEKAVEQSE